VSERASYTRHVVLFVAGAGAAALLMGSALAAYYAWIIDDTPETVLAWYGTMGKREVVLRLADGSLGVCTITGERIAREGSPWMPPEPTDAILWAHTSRGPRVVIAVQTRDACVVYEWAYTNGQPPVRVREIRPFGALVGLAFAELDSLLVVAERGEHQSRLVVLRADAMAEAMVSPPEMIPLAVQIGDGPPLLRRTASGWAAVVTRAADRALILCEDAGDGARATPVTTDWLRADPASPLTIATYAFAPEGIVVSSRDIFHTPLIPWPAGKSQPVWVPI
jgi:hypothetical protein